jgi:hypothetical protein
MKWVVPKTKRNVVIPAQETAILVGADVAEALDCLRDYFEVVEVEPEANLYEVTAKRRGQEEKRGP